MKSPRKKLGPIPRLLTIMSLLFVSWPVEMAMTSAPAPVVVHLNALPAWATPRTMPPPTPADAPYRCPQLLSGGSTISGTLTTDDVWGPGLITVTGDILVNPGVTIVVAPGTTVQMATNDGANLGSDATRIEYIVDGTLQANGPVTFTSQGSPPVSGDWYGIQFRPGSAGYLSTTIVEYGTHAVEINTTTPITIADSTLRYSLDAPPNPMVDAQGAGLLIWQGDHYVLNTKIYSNTVRAAVGNNWAQGAGAHVVGGSRTLFENCALYDNLAQNTTNDAAGGGMNVLAADPTLRNCEVHNNRVIAQGRAFGGGVNLDNSSGIIEADTFIHNNVITATNSSAYGGGVSIGEAMMMVPPTPIIRDSRVMTNTFYASATWGFGGGIGFYQLSNTQGVVSDTLIADNIGLGGAPLGGGIGMDAWATAARFDANLVRDNLVRGTGLGSSGGGGGIGLRQNNNVSVTNNLLFNNRADGTAGGFGGGLYAWGVDSYLVNNTAVSNTATGSGGGVRLQGGVLYNNIIVSNTSGGSGGGLSWTGGITGYNDVWGNAPNDYYPARPPTDINVAPLFLGHGDLATFYHLRQGSLCVDAGTGPGIGIPDEDYDKDARPLNTGWDIGFDEVAFHLYLPIVLKSY